MNALFTGNWKLASAIIVLATTGCSVIPEAQVDLTRYYVLTGSGMVAGQVEAKEGALRLGLKAVQIAPYLDKGTVVVRTGANELIYNDFARWAEPLADSITRVVRERLQTSPVVDQVLSYPFPFNQPRDYDVAINVLSCEGVREGDRTLVRFSVMLEISTTGDEAKIVTRRVFTAPEREWDGRDYGKLVQDLSDAVGTLSDEVVAALPKQP